MSTMSTKFFVFSILLSKTVGFFRRNQQLFFGFRVDSADRGRGSVGAWERGSVEAWDFRQEIWDIWPRPALTLIPITPQRLEEKTACGDHFFRTVLKEGVLLATEN